MARIFLFLIILVQLEAKTVCLNMIVKNESAVIERCLNSVKPMIDYWVIVDTGSTDGTQEIIKKFMKDIPGELYEQPWVNFGYNRNEALKLARHKADYVLFIDADEVISGEIDKNKLCDDCYLGTVVTSNNPRISFQRGLMVSAKIDWVWKGVIHEKLHTTKVGETYGLVETISIDATKTDGRRSQDPNKWQRDALTLEKALLDEPGNSDYVYYLAQSYLNAKEYDYALKNYIKRANMEGWNQHTFWSKYMVGLLQEGQKVDPKVFIKSYSDSFLYRPSRAEPIYRLVNYFLGEKEYLVAYALAKLGLQFPKPNDIVYVESWIYDYGMLSSFIEAARGLGSIQEVIEGCKILCSKEGVPQELTAQAKSLIDQATFKK